MALFCIKPTVTFISDAKRADLLRWLLDNSYVLDLSAVNAELQTPAHCAVQSRSLEVLEVTQPAVTLQQSGDALLDRPCPGEEMIRWGCWQCIPGLSMLGPTRESTSATRGSS